MCKSSIVCSYFLFCFDRDKTSLGIHFWLVLLALTFETLLEIKFGWEILCIPLPKMAVVAWSNFFIVLTVWSLWYFSYPVKQWPILQQHFSNRKKDTSEKAKN